MVSSLFYVAVVVSLGGLQAGKISTNEDRSFDLDVYRISEVTTEQKTITNDHRSNKHVKFGECTAGDVGLHSLQRSPGVLRQTRPNFANKFPFKHMFFNGSTIICDGSLPAET